MEPQDTPPYAPVEGAAPEPTPSTSPPGTAPRRDDAARTRGVVAVAAGASFLAAMTGMAIARSGGSSSPGSATTNAPAPQQVTADDGPAFPTFDDDDGFGREPRAAQPGAPVFGGGGQTQSRGS